MQQIKAWIEEQVREFESPPGYTYSGYVILSSTFHDYIGMYVCMLCAKFAEYAC
jgi:hypothetical protein